MTPEVEARFERIERAIDFLATNQAQLTTDVISLTHTVTALAEKTDRLEAQVDKVSRDVASLVDAVGSLVRLFEIHTSNGHGGRPKEEA